MCNQGTKLSLNFSKILAKMHILMLNTFSALANFKVNCLIMICNQDFPIWRSCWTPYWISRLAIIYASLCRQFHVLQTVRNILCLISFVIPRILVPILLAFIVTLPIRIQQKTNQLWRVGLRDLSFELWLVMLMTKVRYPHYMFSLYMVCHNKRRAFKYRHDKNHGVRDAKFKVGNKVP